MRSVGVTFVLKRSQITANTVAAAAPGRSFPGTVPGMNAPAHAAVVCDRSCGSKNTRRHVVRFVRFLVPRGHAKITMRSTREPMEIRADRRRGGRGRGRRFEKSLCEAQYY